jgi:opacity protein-like surface antigen
VGIEWAFLPNWSAKLEYDFLGLDDRRFIAPAGFRFLDGDIFIERNRNIHGEGGDQLPLQLEQLPR